MKIVITPSGEWYDLDELDDCPATEDLLAGDVEQVDVPDAVVDNDTVEEWVAARCEQENTRFARVLRAAFTTRSDVPF